MFQYAFGRYVSLLLEKDIWLDKGTNLSGSSNRLFDLDIFDNIKATAGDSPFPLMSKDLYRPIYLVERTFSYDQRLVEILENLEKTEEDHLYTIIIKGYWQSPKYISKIESTIRNDFALRMDLKGRFYTLESNIRSCESVMVNVRRGDYLQNLSFHGVVDTEYLESAMKLMEEKLIAPAFFIFSDDIAWCRLNIKERSNVFFVDESFYDSKYLKYFYLMRSCQHFIISNSTFCWWAAWLAESHQKIVIAPKKWFATNKLSADDLIPPDWIRL